MALAGDVLFPSPDAGWREAV